MIQLFQKHGSEHIISLIRASTENGSRTATVSGAWEIDTAIRLPSDFTLILQDCHLRMADGCFSNMFVNEHHGTKLGRTHNGTDHNIAVIGKGRAILDGGEYNGLSESTQMRDGMPPIWKNNLLLFTNVDGFRIENLSCRNQRWWALNFLYCAHGYIGNIDFCASDVWVAEREPNRIARRRCIFASFGVLSLARLISCFAKSHQNLSKMHSPAGVSSFDAADLFESKSFSRRAYRQYVQGERCRNRRNLHVKTNLVRFPFG